MSFFARILCLMGFLALSLGLAGCSSADLERFGLGGFGGGSKAEEGAAPPAPNAASETMPQATSQSTSYTSVTQDIDATPVYIVGEVEYPGEFPFSEGMTVPQLVILAGGYSHRADTDRALVTRKGVEAKMSVDLSNPIAIKPGDIIQIPQKYF